ncbi:MAG: translocation/assembly module TamB domain-containing protein [Bacteroidota bacterium]|nr:translocation/assembly module TamB domain-containing protein [Bacteroidota bacterium]
MFITFFFIVNTNSFQDYIRGNIISYVNSNTDNNIEISDSRYNLKGELIISNVLLSNKNSDTIFNLESLSTKYIPLISNNQYYSSLKIEGLKIYLNQGDKDIDQSLSLTDLEQIFENFFFDNLEISNSHLIIKDDSIQNQLSINNSFIKEISQVQNGVNFEIESFNGVFGNIKIDNFNSIVNFEGDMLYLNSTYLANENNFINGDITIDFDEDLKIKNISNASLNFNIHPTLFNIDQNNFIVDNIYSGQIEFSGSNKELNIDRFFLKNKFFDLNAEINIMDLLSEDIEINTIINSLDVNEEFLVTNYEIDENIDLPLFAGNLNIKNKNLTFNLDELNNIETDINIYGTAMLDNLNYQLNIKSKHDENDRILEFFGINYLDFNSTIRGSSKELNFINSNINFIKNDNEFNIITDSFISNNNLEGTISLSSEKINIDSNLSGNTSRKIFDISSKIDINGEDDSGEFEFSTQSNLNVNLSNSDNIISFLKLKKLYFKNSEEEVELEDLSELNKILNADFITQNNDFDFQILIDNGFFKLESSIGENLKINGYYRNNDDLNIDIKILDLIVNDLHQINKNPISGVFNSEINIRRNMENRTFDLDSELSNLQIKNYDLGDLNINVFGNTDYDSYAVKINLLKDKLSSIQGEGSIIGANEDPNIDIDLIFENFDISFIEKIGSNTMNSISSKVSGEVNLWGKSNNIQHNGKLYLNQSKFKIPYLNIEYLLSDKSEIDLYNQNFEFNNVNIYTDFNSSSTSLEGRITHQDFKNWNLDLDFKSDRLYILNKEFTENENFYGNAYFGGDIKISGPTNQVSIDINGLTKSGTNITIPQSRNYSVDDFSFITFSDLNSYSEETPGNDNTLNKINKTLDLNMNLEINNSAEVEITIDQETGSYISGKGDGNLLMEIDSDGKFNVYGDFVASEGIYNFRNLALIDKKFELKKGGTIIWDGDPLAAQMNIQATYEVPGGANPALLLDNPNFNKKIPTDVDIKLTGELTKPNSPDFEIFFPNTSSTVTSEINYKLNDPEVRQLQAISLLTQGIFINEVSVSIEGVTNNIYEKVSEVFSDILGGNQGPLEVGLNYLQGDKSEILDIKTEDRFGVTLSTKISDKILFNGKIGVPIGGIEETLIIGDVQIDFILNEDGTLKAKVFNRENEFRYIGDELGYTQGIGLSYQVDFQTFRSLLSKIIANNN